MVQPVREGSQEHVDGSGFNFLQPHRSPKLRKGIPGAQSTEGNCSTEGRAHLIGPGSRVSLIGYLQRHHMMRPIVKPHRALDVLPEGVDLDGSEAGRLQSHQG